VDYRPRKEGRQAGEREERRKKGRKGARFILFAIPDYQKAMYRTLHLA
jgi:hypothetical protein